jgi:hypothetical protein
MFFFYLQICIHLHIYTYTYTYLHIHIYINLPFNSLLSSSSSCYFSIYNYIYIYTCTYLHIHVYINLPFNSLLSSSSSCSFSNSVKRAKIGSSSLYLFINTLILTVNVYNVFICIYINLYHISIYTYKYTCIFSNSVKRAKIG